MTHRCVAQWCVWRQAASESPTGSNDDDDADSIQLPQSAEQLRDPNIITWRSSSRQQGAISCRTGRGCLVSGCCYTVNVLSLLSSSSVDMRRLWKHWMHCRTFYTSLSALLTRQVLQYACLHILFTVFSAWQHIAYAIARPSIRLSVCLSVSHTGGSYNKKAVLSQRWPRDACYISRSWAVAEIWPFEFFSRGRRPPSWICSNWK